MFGEAEAEAAIAFHELNLERMIAPRGELVQRLETERALAGGVFARPCFGYRETISNDQEVCRLLKKEREKRERLL